MGYFEEIWSTVRAGFFRVHASRGSFFGRRISLDEDTLEIWNLVQWYCTMRTFEKIYPLPRFPYFRKSCRKCTVKKGVFKKFAKLSGKHLYQSLSFNKVAGLRTLLDDCFWYFAYISIFCAKIENCMISLLCCFQRAITSSILFSVSEFRKKGFHLAELYCSLKLNVVALWGAKCTKVFFFLWRPILNNDVIT